ncbi:ROK family protein [Compostibacter hankyongensis]|uniref:ROK family protein n=1 Tax=Compostibacter hankyongensis TaxID=1007089 RepID=A0ABP8FFY4_9BACT
MNNLWAIGADIGGSHITAALVDLKKKTIAPDSLVRNRLDSKAGADDIIGIWSKTISEAGRGLPVSNIGIAIPGPFDYENGISLIKDQNKYESLYGLDVKTLLAQRLNGSSGDICLRNDAACFLLGETFSGSGRGYEQAIGITLGTGLGTSKFRDGQACDAGLWKAPFKDSMAEDYLSTRWFVKRFFELTGREVSGVRELSGQAGRDPNVKAVFDEFGKNLALFVKHFIRKETPQVVIMGGNIMQAYAFFESILKEDISREFPGVAIRKAAFGEEAALIGAASCRYRELSGDKTSG